MASSSAIPIIDKLRGRKNYTTWKFAMQLDELWEVVSGDKEDDKKDRKALSKIILTVESTNYCHIQNATTAREAWNALEAAFEDSGLTRRVGLLRKLVTTQLSNCTSVDEYVDQITSTAHKLNEIGFKVADEWVGTLLLAGLPDDYRPMIMGLESSGIPITGDAIKIKLLQDVRVHEEAKNSSSETAIYAKKNKKGGGPPRCFVCNKPGHFAKNCRRNKCEEKKPNGNKEKKKEEKKEKAFMAQKKKEDSHAQEWFLDSGSSSHITKNNDNLTNVTPKTDVLITAANNINFASRSIGTAEIQVTNGQEVSTVKVKEALYVPEAATNLLSVSKIVKKGHVIIFDSHGGKIKDEDGEIVATASEVNGIYKIDQPLKTTIQSYLAEDKTGILWHRRLGHLNRKSISLLKNMSVGLDEDLTNDVPCEDCITGKHARDPFNVSKKHSNHRLELIHSDLCGPMEQKSIGDSRYFLTFIDDYSRYLYVYMLEHKDQVPETFKEFKNMVERQTGEKIKVLRTDNGKEYVNQRLKTILKDSGIIHQLTMRYTPQQNGLAERMNCSIVEKARTLLSDARLGKEYWGEAVSTSVYLLNRSPTKRLWNKTPYEVWTDDKPDLSHLRIFGCEAMVLISKESRKKWDPKSQKLLFMGYCENRKGYRLINPADKKIIFSRDVKFLEKQRNQPKSETEVVNATSTEDCEAEEEREVEEAANEDRDEESGDSENYISISEEEEEIVEAPRRSKRERKPVQMPDYVTYYASSIEGRTEPLTVEEALRGPDSQNWKEAMRSETNSLVKNKSYEVVKLPPGKEALKTKWVLTEKRDKAGKKKFKARLVIKGCSQKQGINYQETFSPVVKYASLRYLFSLAAKENMRIDHMDVTTAYLQSDLDEEIYVQPPYGLIKKTPGRYGA